MTAFRLLARERSMVTVTVDGTPVTLPADGTAAAALLLADSGWSRRSPIGGGLRAPYCLMGACFECLVGIDGVPDIQACLTQVHEGMTISRQPGERAADG